MLSVHTIVSFDFAVALVPGWHATVFPPYFVAGAVFSGFAMVAMLMIPARRFLGFEDVVTPKHFDNMCKVILTTSLIVAYGYAVENFINRYSGNPFATHAYSNRQTGFYAPIWYAMVACNCLFPQLFWWKRWRSNLTVIWVVSLFINFGMWSERFIIIVSSLYQDFTPSMWRTYSPTWVDLGLYVGTLCLFSTCFLLFLRFIPPISSSEVKELNHELSHEAA